MAVATKVAIVSSCCGCASTLMQAYTRLKDMYAIMQANGWNAAGSNPIVDGDLNGLGISAAQFHSFLTAFCAQFDRLMSNQTTNAAVNGSVICNQLRNDIS